MTLLRGIPIVASAGGGGGGAPPPVSTGFGPRRDTVAHTPGTSLTPILPANAVTITAPANISNLGSGNYILRGNFGSQTITLPSNCDICGDGTAILDGGGGRQTAVQGSPSNASLRNLVIRGFNAAFQSPLVNNSGGNFITYENLEIAGGLYQVHIPSNSTLRGCWLHDGGQLGLSNWNTDNAVVEDCLIERVNSNDTYDWHGAAGETGGGKFSSSRGTQFRYNETRFNHGPGMWADIDNTGHVWERNWTHDNTGPGFMWEISYQVKMRYNLVEGNGFGTSKFPTGNQERGGILISCSSGQVTNGIEVHNNTFNRNARGVAFLQDGGRTPGLNFAAGHDNDYRGQTSGEDVEGLYVWGNDATYYTSRSNSFDSSTIHAGMTFFWQFNGGRSLSYMQSQSQETHAVTA